MTFGRKSSFFFDPSQSTLQINKSRAATWWRTVVNKVIFVTTERTRLRGVLGRVDSWHEIARCGVFPRRTISRDDQEGLIFAKESRYFFSRKIGFIDWFVVLVLLRELDEENSGQVTFYRVRTQGTAQKSEKERKKKFTKVTSLDYTLGYFEQKSPVKYCVKWVICKTYCSVSILSIEFDSTKNEQLIHF